MVIKTNQLLSELHHTSPKLAEIVEEIISGINSDNNFEIVSKNIQDLLKPSIDRLADNQSINLIPIKSQGACHQVCICQAFGKWNAQKGFAGIFKQIINYWLGCFQANKTTAIFTNAWDQVDFESKYENYFDNYSLGGTHHITIILVSSKDLSLVYSI